MLSLIIFSVALLRLKTIQHSGKSVKVDQKAVRVASTANPQRAERQAARANEADKEWREGC